MARAPGRFGAQWRRVRECLVSDLGEVFAQWIEIPETFANPERTRLFSPLTNVLVVSVPSALGRWLVSGGREEVPRLAGIGRRPDRFTSNSRLLQSQGSPG